MLSLIAVIGKNRELGKDNKLLWHIPGDLPRFRTITTGHPVIMGRKTFESIGALLPDRTNIVISSHATIEGVTVVSSLEGAIEVAKTSPGSDEIFIIGGGSIFDQAVHLADRLYLTVVDMEAPDADTFFPDYARFSHVVSQEPQEDQDYKSMFYILEPESHSSTAPTK
jgi:dihydrofolate reductase